ncbi:MAG: thioredoxin-dependent thiol peroxidase [Gemmatimonadetes bacterium]|nr:thioredoxin-dependent thiol peroxidase [Gemmatimonadota bacterium]
MRAGARAPAFVLQDETGAWVSLADYAGKRIVLFFFQKASTPGCTVEAGEFRDAMPRFAGQDVAVIGISPDTWRRHAKFRAAQGLPYPLLADKDAIVCQAFGVWHRKLFWGRYYMGVIRSTFVIGADGRVEHEWRDVHHEGHAAAVSAWLRGEPAPAGRSESVEGSAKSAAKRSGAASRAARRE